ncbi:MAG TPA: TIGR00366 family protein [Blastocatellia bacterium]
MGKHWIDTFSRLVERLVPDAITTSVILLIGVSIISLSIGNSVTETVDAYYKGLWMLLAFTMQMTLILTLSLILASTTTFKKAVLAVSRIPRTKVQVVALAVLSAAFVSYLNWGLGLALYPMIAIHFCREAERKGISVDFLFMLATLAGAGAVWQFGLSASAPLLMATPGHFLQQTTGIMTLGSTIWSPASIILVIGFTLAVIVAGCLFMPKKIRPISEFPESNKLDEPAKASDEASPEKSLVVLSFAQRLERSSIVVAALCFALICWLYYHFFTKKLSLDINSVNTIILLLGLLLHRTVARFTTALREAIVSSWPIVVMYHLYAGVAGLIQYTSVGKFLAELADPVMTKYSFPLLTVLISTVVAVFIPTSGGQWLIQGFVTVRAAEAVGVTAQRGLLALSVGDHMGNLISPFWAVVGAGIARVDFRSLFGYRLIFAAIWFALGVVAFTFLPC